MFNKKLFIFFEFSPKMYCGLYLLVGVNGFIFVLVAVFHGSFAFLMVNVFESSLKADAACYAILVP